MHRVQWEKMILLEYSDLYQPSHQNSWSMNLWQASSSSSCDEGPFSSGSSPRPRSQASEPGKHIPMHRVLKSGEGLAKRRQRK